MAEYTVQGNYGYGWDDLTAEATKEAARDQLKTYRENEPHALHRVVDENGRVVRV